MNAFLGWRLEVLVEMVRVAGWGCREYLRTCLLLDVCYASLGYWNLLAWCIGDVDSGHGTLMSTCIYVGSRSLSLMRTID